MTGRYPQLTAPPGSCDTHIHFYNDAYPTAPTALMTPPNALVEDYKMVQKRLGLDRVVVVQPTTYGTDNRCQLDAMKTFGANARGVVVPDPSITEAELQDLTDAGVCGVRFHMLPGGALDWDVLEAMAARVHNFGWHVQLQMNGREFPEREALLKKLPCDLVVDHVGRFMGPVPVSDAAFKTLSGFLERGRCWVKLSAPYESSENGPPGWEDVRAEARELAKSAPERMLWASNWPHPGQAHPPDEAELLDLLLNWVDDAATRTKILRDNPAELYRF
ncbi:MAG: amidohydrolase family protein [Desulfofustis sp.]|nr:amidohydrolase family protein [Desulfofustis sp.]